MTTSSLFPMNLGVPTGNVSLSIEVKHKLAERAAYWREQWNIEKGNKQAFIKQMCVYAFIDKTFS